MSGSFFASWWSKVGPYYKATPEVFYGIGIMSILYYKLSYGGKKKAVESKPGH